jgi:hypothetical protein
MALLGVYVAAGSRKTTSIRKLSGTGLLVARSRMR